MCFIWGKSHTETSHLLQLLKQKQKEGEQIAINNLYKCTHYSLDDNDVEIFEKM